MVAFMDALELQVPRDIVSSITRIFGPMSSFPFLNDIVNAVLLPLAKEMARNNLNNFYVVDGLDACTQEECSFILTSFKDLASVSDCHIFISAREGPNREVDARGERTIHLSEHHTREDIQVFVDWKMEEKQCIEGFSMDEQLRADVIDVLNSRAHLMYVYISCKLSIIPLKLYLSLVIRTIELSITRL